MANPGFVFLAFVLAAGQAVLGTSALTDGRMLQGIVGLGIAALFAGWAVTSLRRRQREGSL